MTQEAPRSGVTSAAIALAQMLRFFSRLPVPALPGEADPHALPDFTTAPRWLPLAGAVLALPAAMILWLAQTLWAEPVVAALLAVATLALVTGALHEDGLADLTDAVGGGRDRATRLAILKDSRIGTFGALALMLVTGLRVAALASLVAGAGAVAGAVALIAVAALSRGVMLVPWVILPPARSEGLAATGRPSRGTLAAALAFAAIIAATMILAAGLPFAGLVTGMALAAVATILVSGLAHRALGGHTGDVLGATQQLAEVALLLGLLIWRA